MSCTTTTERFRLDDGEHAYVTTVGSLMFVHKDNRLCALAMMHADGEVTIVRGGYRKRGWYGHAKQ